MKIEELYNTFLEEIEQIVSINVYNVWFSKIKFLSLKDNYLEILVPMSIHKQMLSENYKDIVDNVLLNITGKTYNIKYLTEEEYKEIEENNNIQNNQILDKNNVEEIWETNLNPKFTFDSFVVGDSNRLLLYQLMRLLKILVQFIIHYFYMVKVELEKRI